MNERVIDPELLNNSAWNKASPRNRARAEHAFIPACMQYRLAEHVRYAKHCSRGWGYSSEQNAPKSLPLKPSTVEMGDKL